jgi:hypothetical protein
VIRSSAYHPQTDG